jgi:hypothetical protein
VRGYAVKENLLHVLLLDSFLLGELSPMMSNSFAVQASSSSICLCNSVYRTTATLRCIFILSITRVRCVVTAFTLTPSGFAAADCGSSNAIATNTSISRKDSL